MKTMTATASAIVVTRGPAVSFPAATKKAHIAVKTSRTVTAVSSTAFLMAERLTAANTAFLKAGGRLGRRGMPKQAGKTAATDTTAAKDPTKT